MALRKELVLNWQDKPYKLMVTMAVIDKVEDSINIGRLLAQHATGDVRFSHVAKFMAILLNEAGAEVTQEEVYSGNLPERITSSDSFFAPPDSGRSGLPCFLPY